MKKLIAVFFLIGIMIGSVPTLAESPEHFVKVYGYNAKLYYCDYPTGRVVLRELNHTGKNLEANNMARQSEYLEVKIFPNGIRMKDNSPVTIEDLNLYVDSSVFVIVAKKADGSFVIPYLKFK